MKARRMRCSGCGRACDNFSKEMLVALASARLCLDCEAEDKVLRFPDELPEPPNEKASVVQHETKEIPPCDAHEQQPPLVPPPQQQPYDRPMRQDPMSAEEIRFIGNLVDVDSGHELRLFDNREAHLLRDNIQLEGKWCLYEEGQTDRLVIDWNMEYHRVNQKDEDANIILTEVNIRDVFICHEDGFVLAKEESEAAFVRGFAPLLPQQLKSKQVF